MKPSAQNANAGPGAAMSETPEGQAIPNSPSNEALFAYAVQWPVRLLEDAAEISKVLFLLCSGLLGGGLAFVNEMVQYAPIGWVVKTLLFNAWIVSAVCYFPSTKIISMHPERIRDALVDLAETKHRLSKATMWILSTALILVLFDQAFATFP